MDNNVIISIFTFMGLTKEYAQRYKRGMNSIFMLSYMEIYLMFFLVEELEEDNRVDTDGDMRERFVNWCLRISALNGEDNIIRYSEASVKVALHNLKKYNILIADPNRRGKSWVNPEYWFAEQPTKRKNMINHIERKLEEV